MWGTRFLLRIRPALLPTGSAGCGWRFQESHILSPPAADAQQKAAKKTCWRSWSDCRSLLFPPVWFGTAKNASEKRDISQTTRIHASLFAHSPFWFSFGLKENAPVRPLRYTPSSKMAILGCSLRSSLVTRSSGMRGALSAPSAGRQSSSAAMGQALLAAVL